MFTIFCDLVLWAFLDAQIISWVQQSLTSAREFFMGDMTLFLALLMFSGWESQLDTKDCFRGLSKRFLGVRRVSFVILCGSQVSEIILDSEGHFLRLRGKKMSYVLNSISWTTYGLWCALGDLLVKHSI